MVVCPMMQPVYADPSFQGESSKTYIPGVLRQALTYGLSVIKEESGSLRDFPNLTEGGEWQTTGDGGWTGGFWVGLLWLASALTSEPTYAERATDWSGRLAPRATDNSTHDLGFLFLPSCVQGFRLTGISELRDLGLMAARTLASRFHEPGQLIPEKGVPGDTHYGDKTLVDTMMNLPLLYWASQETGDETFQELAICHARTCLRYHVRADGSTAQSYFFEPRSGELLGEGTDHGYAPDSRWTRGLAWAVYGFTTSYRATKMLDFLHTARLCSNAFCAHLPRDHVPYWDYDAPDIPDAVRDSSAAAVAASGLLDLAEADPNPQQGRVYRRWAMDILVSLAANYTTRMSENHAGILAHGTRSVPLLSGIDGALIYGDYYFMEALTKIIAPETWSRIDVGI